MKVVGLFRAHGRAAIFLGLLFTFFVGGLAATVILAKFGREEVRTGYLRAAKAAAAGFEGEDVALMQGRPEDTALPVYDRARRKLIGLREANPDSRFVYLMAVRDNKVVFLADAEPPESPDFSAPGTPYEEASPELLDAFKTGKPFIEGPFTDRWGVWVTSLAPIRDRQTGAVLCLLGWDWNATTWRMQTGIYLWPGLALTLFAVLLLATGFYGYTRIERVNLMLTEETAERRRAQGELQRLAKQDPLTGLGNRRTFDTALDLEWRRALRAQTPVSLLMLDIDKFKAFNDHYGHQTGDQALKRVAECFRGSAKRAGDEACRYGGEEFVAILPGTDQAGAMLVAERVRASVEAASIAHEYSGSEPILTVSIGVATTIPTPDDTPSAFLYRADRALYHAKESGRNRVEVLSSDLVLPGPKLASSDPSLA